MLLRERDGLRPRVPTTLLRETALLRETVRLRPWTRDLWLLQERAGLRPRVSTTLLRETVRLWPWGLKCVPTSDQGDRDFYTQLTHAVYTNHPANNSDVWVLVTTKGVKTQVDFSPGGFSSSYMRGCLLSGKNKFSGSAN